MKRTIKIAAIIFVLLLVSFVAFDSVMRPKAASAQTRVFLQNAALACAMYSTYFGKSPTSLANLERNLSNVVFISWGRMGSNDGWGHPIHLKPFDSSVGHGSVVSYGRDGRPGGEGLDADVEVYFQEQKR